MGSGAPARTWKHPGAAWPGINMANHAQGAMLSAVATTRKSTLFATPHDAQIILKAKPSAQTGNGLGPQRPRSAPGRTRHGIPPHHHTRSQTTSLWSGRACGGWKRGECYLLNVH